MGRLYVGNLPYVAQKKDIRKLFDDNGIPIRNVDISIDPFTGRNPSYCFVDLEPQFVDPAMTDLQGQDVRGRPVKINFSTEKRAKKPGPPTKTYDLGWTAKELPAPKVNHSAYVFNRWASPEEAEKHWTLPVDEKRRLYVGGMPRIPRQTAVNADMRELFRKWNITAVSKIISPREPKRSQPGSHYYCFVDFESAVEAVEAAFATNGTETPYGGTYHVRLGNLRKPGKVLREQLGGIWPTATATNPVRNLAGNWRRVES